jgi:hypothetical protein
MQIPSAWSAPPGTQTITITVNQGTFENGSAYLFVVDPDGSASSGYEITFGEGGDSTPPEVSNTTVGTDGETVTINFSETVVTTGYDNGDFDLDCTNSGADIDLNSISGSGSQRTFTAASTIYKDDTCTIDYTGGADEIEDAAGNDLAQFSDAAVTNNSLQLKYNTSSGVSMN